VVVATRAIPKAVQRANVVDFAISAFGGAARFRAAKLCASFCCRSREPPNVFALPGSATRIGAPSASAFASDHFVAPMAATKFAAHLDRAQVMRSATRGGSSSLLTGCFACARFVPCAVKSNAYETIRRQFRNMSRLISSALGCSVAPDISFHLQMRREL
jgi:hypothetical protein